MKGQNNCSVMFISIYFIVSGLLLFVGCNNQDANKSKDYNKSDDMIMKAKYTVALQIELENLRLNKYPTNGIWKNRVDEISKTAVELPVFSSYLDSLLKVHVFIIADPRVISPPSHYILAIDGKGEVYLLKQFIYNDFKKLIENNFVVFQSSLIKYMSNVIKLFIFSLYHDSELITPENIKNHIHYKNVESTKLTETPNGLIAKFWLTRDGLYEGGGEKEREYIEVKMSLTKEGEFAYSIETFRVKT